MRSSSPWIRGCIGPDSGVISSSPFTTSEALGCAERGLQSSADLSCHVMGGYVRHHSIKNQTSPGTSFSGVHAQGCKVTASGSVLDQQYSCERSLTPGWPRHEGFIERTSRGASFNASCCAFHAYACCNTGGAGNDMVETNHLDRTKSYYLTTRASFAPLRPFPIPPFSPTQPRLGI